MLPPAFLCTLQPLCSSQQSVRSFLVPIQHNVRSNWQLKSTSFLYEALINASKEVLRAWITSEKNPCWRTPELKRISAFSNWRQPAKLASFRNNLSPPPQMQPKSPSVYFQLFQTHLLFNHCAWGVVTFIVCAWVLFLLHNIPVSVVVSCYIQYGKLLFYRVCRELLDCQPIQTLFPLKKQVHIR